MSGSKLHEFLIDGAVTIATAFARIDRNLGGIVLLVDGDGRLDATLTDGDLRRAILAGFSLEATIAEVIAHKRSTSTRRPITMPVGTSRAALVHLMKTEAIVQIPLVDDDGRVVEVALLKDLVVDPDASAAHAVVMAGGYGTRLQPMTFHTPKPMLPVGDKPLLERTISRLQSCGFANVSVTTHYLPEKIASHFGDGSKFGVNLNYVHESEPRGTAGALRFLGDVRGPVLVINGDVLTTTNFDAMFRYHAEHMAQLTVAVREFGMVVPYGVVEAQGPLVRRVVEKPRQSYFINAGIYIIEPAALQLIPPDRHFDMPDLIQLVIERGERVAGFPIYEYWLDIGRHEDYQRAQEDVLKGRLG